MTAVFLCRNSSQWSEKKQDGECTFIQCLLETQESAVYTVVFKTALFSLI